MIARVRAAVDRYHGIGVRIEDDYLVTDSGVEWLSAGLPRAAEEVEGMRKGKGGASCGKPSM